MKNNLRIVSFESLILIFACILFIGCEAELEKNPLDEFATETFWKSENEAYLALTGVYRGNIQMNNPEFSPTDWWSYNGLMFLEFASDNAYDRRGDNAATVKLSNGTNTATNGYVKNYWENSYNKISRSNDFLENIDKVSMEEEKISRYSAEVRAIRACQYFYLAQYWGDVPLVTSSINSEEANKMRRTSKKEVMQFVINELQLAAKSLPSQANLEASEVGRFTKQAALGFLGRALLAEEKFEMAGETYKEIIDMGENIIDPNYESLFEIENENSQEIIFSTQYVKNEGSNAMFQHFFPAVKGGWHMFNPLASLVEAYQFKDGTPFSFKDSRYDAENISKNRDPRLGYSVLFNRNSFGNKLYITHPDSTSSPDQLGAGKQTTQTGFGLKKMMNSDFEGNLSNSGVNLPIIRYAEILLGYLEAKLEAGDAISQSLLDETINKVRGRVSVNMPPITVTNKNSLRKILRNERRVELAFEGIRYWDLLRWKTAEKVLNNDFYGAPFPNTDNIRSKINQDIDSQHRWYVTTRNFRPNIDYLWPIPQSEISINTNLEQNPGY
ncbi:RagB/SusD family nutrient uptake outer membrane protein [Salegentibacter sp. BLCTC]|uniref:RagB/SusD family nutrient uptake outer membrane protein n=1 Tax=Salegentibacter sp. BLCTC TaxID=2697368 RepID=UPI00187B3251|nr:RagB/SusD family nutrient uptake outer membrane protein [Salegentibacter sp. BLCTC]MBE7640579.1 RagB/SusD family nutrient uptake outer membrane protein [Salegentibacter sp. BLCTC]